MKNLNLSYVLFAVFIVTVITVMTCGKEERVEVHVMPEEVLSFPNPEEVKEEVEAKVEEVKEVIIEKTEEIIELIPALEELPLIEEVVTPEKVEEIPIEETPADTTKTEETDNKPEGEPANGNE